MASTSDAVDPFEPTTRIQSSRPTPVDHTGLEAVGFVFAGVTVLVIAIAVLVAQRHIAGKDGAEQSARAAHTVSYGANRASRR